MLTPAEVPLVKAALSAPRMSTYERAVVGNPAPEAALTLYEWNARISAAFLFPQQICEVTARNAASEVLEKVFGPHWPWSAGFEQSLPNPSRAYSMRKDLVDSRAKITGQNTGKVITELKFKFWVSIFTARFDQRLWRPHLAAAFPHLPAGLAVSQSRLLIHDELDLIRQLRNRIAHHEPIFSRSLYDDYDRARKLIEWRCPLTAAWMDAAESVSTTLALKP